MFRHATRLALAPLILTALILALSTTCRGELVVRHDDDKSLITYRLMVTPAGEPDPAFRYRLSAPPQQLRPGNAPAFYRRAHAENNLRGTREALNQQVGDRWDRWCTSRSDQPLSQVPTDELGKASRLANNIVEKFVRPASLCRDCEWGLGIEDLRGPAAIDFLLPEYQGMREMARMTALVTRHAIAERRYADAVELLRMNYRMGRDTAKTPFLVCGLIGIAIDGITNDNTMDLIAAPGSPNLYWALGDLPAISLRDALRLEMSIGERIFPLLANAETATHAPEEWNRLWAELQRAAAGIEPFLKSGVAENNQSILASVFTAAGSMVAYPHAKQRLIDWGYEAERVDKMPVGQVLAIYSSRVYRIHSNNFEKATTLPFAEAQRRLDALEAELANASGPFSKHPNRDFLSVPTSLLPAVRASLQAEMRLRREAAVLRAIEAVRMHAAETGSLPASLDEITCVPVPPNPATDEPFRFEAEQANFVFGDEAADIGVVTFVLPGAEVRYGLNRRYEVRLAE